MTTYAPKAIAGAVSHGTFAVGAGADTYRYLNGTMSQRHYGTNMGMAVFGLIHSVTFGISVAYMISDPMADEYSTPMSLGPTVKDVW